MVNPPMEVACSLALAGSKVRGNLSRTLMQGRVFELPRGVHGDMDLDGCGGSIRLHQRQHRCRIQQGFAQGHRNTLGGQVKQFHRIHARP